MSRPQPAGLKPRKKPVQSRSAATVEAIHTATIQVLLASGPAQLTTTRVAQRAGVSVGTMYQYYPHKEALLFAIVERKLGMIEEAMRLAVAELAGRNLTEIAQGIAQAWLDAKMADLTASRAIYGIAAEFDISEPILQCTRRMVEALEQLLISAPDAHFDDPSSTAFMLAALMGGSVRAVMEAGADPDDLARMRRELPRACLGYLELANRGHLAPVGPS
ncbi:TetR/AcrR family transcriptional regulator [Paracoccus aestuariivivens]|nr:TetR/AcrR family transcriptional regulator [Paracoccus aestuariivivens]